ncbi:putative phage tail protein [Clostridium sp. HMP27]|uniref:putative phage tail protein n=1 Tax=Clostridium sp. HMP27 TaxID=1487921 RepID=UPI00052D750E|nr:putative phage tail protein [Clostridium sp. HMP27]KGK88047.1 hypothetical protein DP68_08965 [Clostridium sp. HMP27]
MNKADELKSYLPTYYQESIQMNAKCDSTGEELEGLYSNIFDLTKQCFPQTATWGIEYWENFLGIPVNSSEELKTRRAKVITKMSRASPMTPYEMRRILRNFVDRVVITQFPEEYRFEVTLETKTKLENVLDAVIREVEEIKPAHLDFGVAINYITELTLITQFSKWFSDPFILCGTIDVSYNPYIATDGWSFEQIVSSSLKEFRSDEFLVASETTFILGDGKTLSETLRLSINKWNSDELKVVYEDNFIKDTDGRTLKESLNLSIINNKSQEFKQASEEAFIYGVDGKTINGALIDSVNRLYSEELIKVSEDTYVRGGVNK